MKNKIILAALLLSSSYAFAGPGMYLGVNAGSVDHQLNFDGESGSDTSTGVKVYAGYQVTTAFAVEAGYVHFGDLGESDPDYSISFKPKAVYAAVTGTMAFSPIINLFGKVGVARTDSTLSESDRRERFSMKRNLTSAMLGFGAQYKFSETLSAVAEYEYFGKIANLDDGGLSDKAAMVSVGVRYTF